MQILRAPQQNPPFSSTGYTDFTGQTERGCFSVIAVTSVVKLSMFCLSPQAAARFYLKVTPIRQER